MALQELLKENPALRPVDDNKVMVDVILAVAVLYTPWMSSAL